jgi:excisionase family DNA binding protein
MSATAAIHDPHITETVTRPLLYDRSEAAEILKIGLRTLAKLIARGEIATVRIGGRTLISSGELLAFIERKTVRKPSDAEQHSGHAEKESA